MTAATAIVRLKLPMMAPVVSVGVTEDIPRGLFKNFICYPRRSSHSDALLIDDELIELLAVDANADLASDYTFCVFKSDIDKIIFCHGAANPADVADLIDAENTGSCDVRSYDLGYSGGSDDLPAISVFEQVAPLATTGTDIYTVPASKTAKITSMIVCNSGAATSFRISISKLGAVTAAKDYIMYDVAIGANTTTFIDLPGITLAATDVVRVYATLATLSFTISGDEFA